MPVIFRRNNFRFLFYSNEGSPREPMHIHVLQGDIEAKFWLWPTVSVVYNDGFSAKTIRELVEVIEQRRDKISESWHEFFGEG